MATRAAAAPLRIRRERMFYSGMAFAMLALVFAGFAPSFYLRGTIPASFPLLPMTPLVVAHGVIFSAWTLLFVSQASLVSAGRVDLHRRFGVLGLLLLLAMVTVGALTALHGVARASGPPMVPPLSFLAVPLFDVPVFAGLIGAALWFRRTPQIHKRLMLIAMIGMMPPAVGRLPLPDVLPPPVALFGIPDLLLVALVAWDFASRGKLHRATLWGGGLLVASQVFRLAVWETEGWLTFAAWAAGLVQ